MKEARQLSLYLKIAHRWGGWTIKHVVETYAHGWGIHRVLDVFFS